MKALSLALLLCGCIFAKEPEPYDLMLLPGGLSPNPEDNPSMTVYLPEKEKASGAGVVVVPGGSFLIRCEDHEGRQIARWLAARGIAAFVVHYRLIPRFTIRDELDDVRRAAQIVRARAEEFGVKRIGMIGFSAGAYLTGEVALKPWEANPLSNYFVEKVSSRLDFMALVYGAPGGTNDPVNGFNRFFADQVGMEDWRKLTATTPEQISKAPPTFMFCTMEDRGAARRMGEFHLQLLQQGVPGEAHFFASGPHGVGFAQNDPVLGEWPNLFLNWMRAKEFLSSAKGLPIAGLIKVDGKPLELGYVVFTAKSKSQNVLHRTAYVFNRSGEKGSFRLPEGQGLIPGEYEATVYQMAAKWNSVWAEPLLNRIQTKLNSGEKLTDSDIADWNNWAIDRHYEPTLQNLVKCKTLALKITLGNAGAILIDASSTSH